MRSLRLRLLLGAALWIALALLVAGVAIAWLYIHSVERSLRVDLSAATLRLAAAIDPAASDQPRLDATLADPRYGIPAGGLYWQVERSAPNTVWRSRSLWDTRLTLPETGRTEAFSILPGPGGQSLSVLSRVTRFTTAAGPQTFRIAVAQDRALLDASVSRFARDLAIALSILGMALVVAAWAQVSLGLRPLDRLRSAVESVRQGRNREVSNEFPSEIMPLVAEVNELLSSQEESIKFARTRASDLAHGLKTPLSVLSSVASALRDQGDEENAAVLDDLTDEMAQRIDYQLRLARLRRRTRTDQLSASLNEVVDRTLAVVRKTQHGETLGWHIFMEDNLELDIDRNDLIELVGVILENAAKWAETSVRVEAKRVGRNVNLVVADDGPGMSASEIARVGTARGERLDTCALPGVSDGTGFGIAIAREVAALNRGRIDFETAHGGGLAVSVTLPAARRVAT